MSAHIHITQHLCTIHNIVGIKGNTEWIIHMGIMFSRWKFRNYQCCWLIKPQDILKTIKWMECWSVWVASEECTLSMANKNLIRKTSNDEIQVLTSEQGVQFLGISRCIAHHNPFGTICGDDHVQIIRCGNLTIRRSEKSAPIKNIWVMWAWGIEWTDSKKDTKRRMDWVD